MPAANGLTRFFGSVVPSFVFDRQYTISGAQEAAALAQVLDQVAQLAAGKETSP